MDYGMLELAPIQPKMVRQTRSPLQSIPPLTLIHQTTFRVGTQKTLSDDHSMDKDIMDLVDTKSDPLVQINSLKATKVERDST